MKPKVNEQALVRQCDGCGMTTAADLDLTPQHAEEMWMSGQTVRQVTRDEALRLWRDAGPCCCKRSQPNPETNPTKTPLVHVEEEHRPSLPLMGREIKIHFEPFKIFRHVLQ